MGKRVLAVVVLVLLCVGGWYLYKHARQGNSLENGEVHWVAGRPSDAEQARFNREDHGETADGQSEHKAESARQSAAEIAAGGSGYAGQGAARTPAQNAQFNTVTDRFNNEPANRAIPAEDGGTTSMRPAPDRPDARRDTYGGDAAASTYPAPNRDTLPAAAPNGMRFAGTGTYQWYREGNLTWRIDTATGQSCIVYATMEEWRKPIVMNHGCARSN